MKKEKVWMNKADSFAEAERFDEQYYQTMSGYEKIEVMQFLREQYLKMKGLDGESRKRLRRVVKFIKQK